MLLNRLFFRATQCKFNTIQYFNMTINTVNYDNVLLTKFRSTYITAGNKKQTSTTMTLKEVSFQFTAKKHVGKRIVNLRR